MMSRLKAIQRRAFLIGLLASALPVRGYAITLVDLKGLGDAIDAAAGALGKLADSVAHIVSLGDRGWSVASARSARERLKDMDARLADLARTKQSVLVDNMRLYVELGERMIQASGAAKDSLLSELEGSWRLVIDGISQVLTMTNGLMDELRADRSDFVLESARGTLIDALQSKIGLLDKLKFDANPQGPDEIAELKNVSENFDTLRLKTIAAVDAMSDYIKKIEN
jgi:hypothetical protein